MNRRKGYFPLIVPESLVRRVSFVEVLYLERTPEGVNFDVLNLNHLTIKHFDHQVQNDIRTFTDGGFFDLLQTLNKQHAKSKSGISQEAFVERAIYRVFAEKTTAFFQIYQDKEVYHKFLNDQNRYVYSKCQLSTISPEIKFEVVPSEDESLHLQVIYFIAGKRYAAKEVVRSKFLICIEKTYYILQQKDFQALENLAAKDPEQYAYQPNVFMHKVILPLEERYEVDKGDYFDVHVIDCVPQAAVMLSEISNSFLMFTPRWEYDGFVVEGNYQPTYSTHVNGELYEVKRSLEAETNFSNYLQALHPAFKKQLNGYFYLSFADAKKKQWFLKTYHQLLEGDIEIVGMDILLHFRYSPHEIATEMELLQQTDTSLQLYMKVSFGKDDVSLRELKKLLLSGQSFVLLKDDSMGVLTEEWIQSYSMLIKHGQINGNIINVPQWILLALQTNAGGEQLQLSISQDWWEKWKQWQEDDGVVIPVPTNLKAELRPYQLRGFEWMCLLSEIGAGALLADDMGLGKTLQTITFMLHRLSLDHTAKFIIICPASLIYNWSQEILKFSDDLKPHIYQFSQRDLQDFFDSDEHVLICSYGTMRSDIEKLSVIYWDTVVIDESHYIKNQTALTTRAIMHIQAKAKIGLSGTPVMNHTEDLYPQLNFLLPEYLGSSEFFRKEYALPIDRNRDEKKMQALQKLIQPFVLRRTKGQVATELPEKTESVYWCEMDEEQKSFYDEVKNSIKNSIFIGIKNQGMNKSRFSVLQGIIKLRQVCASPTLVKGMETRTHASVKLDALIKELKDLDGHKALVFSQFLGMMDLIGARCDKEGIAYYRIDGSVSKQERARLVEEFQGENNEVGVFLMSMGSGSVGLTLTAADYVFLVDPWWNTALQQQAIDRAHRIGQTRKVFAYKMICKDTIEEKILKLQQKKQVLSEDLISAEEGFVKQLTEEDVKYLFD